MAHSPSIPDVSRLHRWLDRPLRPVSCVVGWCAATAVFVALVSLLGGPSHLDVDLSLFATLSIAHGQFACAFPPGHTTIAPFYSVLSGGVTELGGIGRSVPYPTQASLGPHCQNIAPDLTHWWTQAHALDAASAVGYLGWLALLAGAVAFLRACGNGRCGWEPATLLGLACLPSVWMCIQSFMHPEDLLTMGLCLLALAAARTNRWVWAGLFVALAILTQQWALLVAIPLLVLAPRAGKVRFLLSAFCSGLVVVVPLAVATSGQVVHAITEGAASVPGLGGTVLWDTHLYGRGLFVASRLLPLVLSLIVSRWAVRRTGATASDATALLCVVALSFSLRLVFEEAMFGYYFMALAVTLVLLDVVRGRVRDSLVAWALAIALVYQPLTASKEDDVLSLFAIAGALCLIALRAQERKTPLVWVALLACALVTFRPLHLGLPAPVWQTLFVATGIALAAGPLLARRAQGDPVVTHPEPSAALAPEGPRSHSGSSSVSHAMS
jgi:hypothetical protein